MGNIDDVENTKDLDSDNSLGGKPKVPQGKDTTKHKVKSAIVLESDDSFGGTPKVLQGKDPKVKSTTVLRSDNSLDCTHDVLQGKNSGSKKKQKQKQKRKKQAAALKALEESILKIAEGNDKATKKGKDGKSKSKNNKKKENNRWIKDLPKDYRQALSKLLKS